MPDLRLPEDLVGVARAHSRVFRLQLARAWAHGQKVSDAEVAEAMINLGQEALDAEKLLTDCLRTAHQLGQQALLKKLHRAPGVDHQMLDESVLYSLEAESEAE